MALTFLIGLGHPVSIPQAWAQSSPVPFDLIGDQPQVSLLGHLPAHDPTVGTVAGSGGVTGGAATYEIPIIVPPGRRGMQPALSLGYSSRSGNGIAGMGWDGFAALREDSDLPIYAIGGLGRDDLPTARTHGAQGIAAIRGLWAVPL